MSRVRAPDWPAVLSTEGAAQYLSLSKTTFRTQIAAQVRAIQLTPGRKGWLRSDLDAWLAAKVGQEAPDNPWH